MRFIAPLIVLTGLGLLATQASAALVPQGGQAQVILTRIDHDGPDEGVERTIANSGPQPIGVFPNTTTFGPIADTSLFSGAVAQVGISHGSSGDQSFVIPSAVLAQPPTARAENRLRLDFATAYTSSGVTAAQDITLAYPVVIDVGAGVDPTDPAPFADIAAVVVYAVNGVALADTAILSLTQNGPTAGPVAGVVAGPDGAVSIPSLNDGDVLTMVGTLVFRTNSASITVVCTPEPSALAGSLLFTAALLSRRTRTERRT